MPAGGTRDRAHDAKLVTARAAVSEKVQFLLESERWPAERRAEWVAQRVSNLLSEARRTPFWSERIPLGATLEDVPPLEREQLRDELARLRPPGDRVVVAGHTSGSTGRPVTVEHGPGTIGFASAARLRQLTWFGLPPRELPHATVINSLDAEHPLVRRVRADPPGFAVSPFAFDADRLAEAHAEIVAAGGITLLGANTTVFVQWAELYAASEIDAVELGARLAIVGSEMTAPAQRRRIEEVFGCATAEMYGSHESPMIATECAAGSLHVNEEVVLLEVLRPDGSAADAGELGEVALTLLHNTELPLLRYRLGDAAVVLDGPCACGRTLRRLDVRLGHLEEMVMRPDGTLLHPRFIRTVFEEWYAEHVRAWHTVQVERARFVIYLDLAAPLPHDAATAIERWFERFLRDPVTLELVPDADRARARLPNGKRRAFTRAWG